MAQPEESRLEQYRKERLQEEIAQISGSLSQVQQADRPRFPEHYFVGIFLPLFAGDEQLPYPVTIERWVRSVAGSPYSEVDVVDPAGNVLYTVPPVLDRDRFKSRTHEREGKSIMHIVESAKQYAALSPRAGQEFLSAELTKKALFMKVPENVIRHLQRWNEIFTRYGRPPLMEMSAEQQPAAGAPTSKSNLTPGEDFEMQLL